MRFLFCALASHGFVYPAIGIAQVLRQHGHEVAFVTDLTFSDTLRQAGFARIPRGQTDGPSFQIALWGEPLAVAIQVKHIEYALEQFSPDVMLGQQLTFGPLIAANRHRLPVAILGLAAYLWPASAALLRRAPRSERERRLVWRYAAMMDQYNHSIDLFMLKRNHANHRETPLLGDLFLLQSVPELEGNVHEFPRQIHLIGACLWESLRVDAELIHWLEQAHAAQKPVIYVQPGQSFQAPGFWPHLLTALADRPVCVVASVGRMDSDIGAIPGNFFVRDHASQGIVLPRAQAVICSGHTTTVLGALTHGLPSLLMPNGSGTEDITERCQHAGAAISLAPSTVTAELLQHAVETLLHCSSLRQNAQTLQQAFAQVNGLERAADLLEQLAVTRQPVLRQIHQPYAV